MNTIVETGFWRKIDEAMVHKGKIQFASYAFIRRVLGGKSPAKNGYKHLLAKIEALEGIIAENSKAAELAEKLAEEKLSTLTKMFYVMGYVHMAKMVNPSISEAELQTIQNAAKAQYNLKYNNN